MFLLALLACQPDDGGGKDRVEDTAAPEDTEVDPIDTEDTGVEPLCEDPPSSGAVNTVGSCEYVPEPSGNVFDATVEWAMTHELVDPSTGDTVPAYTFAEEDELHAVFQAPAVGQATDDNGDGTVDQDDTPDIAVNMGDEFGEEVSILRLLSGDGSEVHDSLFWTAFAGDSYAPYLFAGVAMADIDSDGRTEIVTTVTNEEGLCFPAAYEVSSSGQLSLESVGDDDIWCAAHAPSLADIDGDGWVDVVLGDQVLDGRDLSLWWEGGEGRGWYHSSYYGVADGYWNSGYHSFAYDMDGDGLEMEVVAGNTVYNADGSLYCELGHYGNSGWEKAKDGYPAVADIRSKDGKPEIVISGNNTVGLFKGQPDGNDRCVGIDIIDNAPFDDEPGLPTHPLGCDTSRRSFGGPPTVADFNGDGVPDIGVAGSCYYTVYSTTGGSLDRYAMVPTRDWSSVSTGSTVFDFNGDGSAEVVFSDELAVYVWGIDTSSGLDPWERFIPLLEDSNHSSWTIHEYPLVADVDGDGKAEIVAVNGPRPDSMDAYGLYVLGAADDDWVSARPIWNQHAYYVTNIDDDGDIGYADPNYSPFTSEDYNSFRQQAPGSFGALAAPNLYPEVELCQAECGSPALVWVQVANEAPYISADGGIAVSVYGVKGNNETLLSTQLVPSDIQPGDLTGALEFSVSNWSSYDELRVLVDDPSQGGSTEWGQAKECDEEDNDLVISLSDLCE